MRLEALKLSVDAAIAEFAGNELFRRLEGGSITVGVYRDLLRAVAQQSYEAPATFAIAAANCPPALQAARDYLFRHAEEEQGHWRWAVNDLSALGEADVGPLFERPSPAAQAYIAFNYYIAMRNPIARLGAAAVLEGIGAAFGGIYSAKMAKLLALKPNQMTFFSSHGNTDKTHVLEIWDILAASPLTADLWDDLEHAAVTASALYRCMYDEAVRGWKLVRRSKSQ